MKKIIGILFSLLISYFSFGQSVGVVLGGGGSRGMAHIGVLKSLEENNIPIDYIIGTSAGAIVGGLYSAGYSIEEITEIFESGLIQSFLSPELEKKGYISKELNPTPEWITVKFKLDSLFKFKVLPTNIISSDAMDFGFMTFFSQATTACKNDFDNLMVPFRCVASSVNENKPYILSKGDLGSAIRASMSFPFYFSPIKIDDKVLLDGGMYNNFPVDVMEETFNPDLIIGVSISSSYPDPDETDIISVLQNVFMFDINLDMPDNGILIEPNVKDIPIMDFSEQQKVIDSGYVACNYFIDSIKNIVTRELTLSELKAKREEFNQKKPPLFFTNVFAANVNKGQEEYIKNLIIGKRDFLSVSELKDKYDILTSLNNISSSYPIAEYNDSTGLYDLYLNIKQNYNLEAKIGGNISIGGVNQAYFGVQHRYFSRFSLDSKLNLFFGNFYNGVGIETKIDYPTKVLIYNYLDMSVNRKNYYTTSGNFYIDSNPSYLIQDEKHIQFRMGMPIFRRSEFYLRTCLVNTKDSFYNTNYFSSSDVADIDVFTGLASGITYSRSTLNDYFFPDNGHRIQIDVDYVFGNENYTAGTTSLLKSFSKKQQKWLSVYFTYEHFLLSKKRFSIGLFASGAFSTQTNWANYTSSLLHAKSFEPFQDSKIRFLPEYRSNTFATLGAKVIYKFSSNIFLFLEGYAYTPFFQLQTTEDQEAEFGEFFNKIYYLGSAGVVFRNAIAPISLNFNLYNNKEMPFSVTFNIGHIIFNSYGI